jgi:Domain of unknown function (DUF4157)
MFSSAEKTKNVTVQRQQQQPGQTFFRKAGEESFFGAKESQSFFSPNIQAKLSVSSPDDPQEKEADAVADQVMRMPEPAASPEKKEEDLSAEALAKEEKVQKKEDSSAEVLTKAEERKDEQLHAKLQSPVISIQRKCDACEKENHAQAKLFRMIQRSEDASSLSVDIETADSSSDYNINRKELSLHHSDVIQRSGRGPPQNSIQPSFDQSLSSSKGGGSPLPSTTQQFMESRFNADFSGVRIHTGSYAENLSSNIHAQAFTHGNDIYFNSGKYSPHTEAGGTLLAHELTHTIQQGASNQAVKNSNKEANPVLPFNQPANDKYTLLPGLPAQGKNEQPVVPQNLVPRQPESPLKDDLLKDNQPTELNKEAPAAETPADPNAPAGRGDNNQALKSLPAEHAAQTKHAKESAGDDKGEAVGNGDSQKADKATLINDRISKAKDSVIKPHVVNQAAIVNQDYFVTEARLNKTYSTKKQEIRNLFRAARSNIDVFFIGNLQAFSATIQAAQATITGQINAALAGVQSFINTMSAMAITLVTTAIGFVSTLVATTLTAIAGAINNVAGKVTSLVNSVSLPDLPGVAAARDFITNSINSVSGLITGALRSVQMMIISALTISLQFLTGLIQTIAGVINTILSTIASVLNGIINGIAAGLQSILQTVISTLQNLLNGTIHPMLVNIEIMILDTVDKFYQKALLDAKENREQALEALAGMVNEQSETVETKTCGTPMTITEIITEIELTGKHAMERNKEIANRFDEDVSFLIGLLRQQSVVFIALIIAAIIGGMAMIISKVMELISYIAQYITELAAKVIAEFMNFVSKIIESIVDFMTSVGEFINDPFGTVQEYVAKAWDTIASFVSTAVSSFIKKLFNINSQQGPAVQSYAAQATQKFKPTYDPGTIIEEIVKVIVEAFGVIFLAIILGVLTVIAYLLEVVIPLIMIGIAAILLIYLLWRLIGGTIPIPKPPCPRPQCEEGEIFDPAAPSGLLAGDTDRIEMTWYKPTAFYPDPIDLQGEDYYMEEKKELPPPQDFELIGVDAEFMPFSGKTLSLYKEGEGPKKAWFRRRLEAAGYDWAGMDADHVQDIMWNGPDEYENMWPLNEKINRDAGRKQNQEQVIYFRPDDKRPCAVRMSIGMARGEYPMDGRRFKIGSFEKA